MSAIRLRATAVLAAACAVLAMAVPAPAATGGQGIAILDTGVGGKATAMGGAFTAVSDDATAIVWNPAGLVQVDGDELTLYYDGVSGFFYNTGFFGYARNMGILTLGAGIKFLFSGSQENFVAGSVESFKENQFLFLVSAGFNLPFPVKPGITLKYGLRNFSYEDQGGPDSYYKNAGFFNIDIGLLYPLAPWLTFGLKVENVLPNLDFSVGNGPETVPTRLSLGASTRFLDDALRLSLDAVFVPALGDAELRFGLEYRLLPSFSLYGGLDAGRVDFGVNYYLTDFSFYASTLLSAEMEPSARFALHYKIGKSKREYRSIEKQMTDLTRGLESFTRGDYKEAQKHFENVLKENPTNATARRLGEITKHRLETEDWRTPQDKSAIERLFAEGEARFRAGEWGPARQAFLRVLEIDPAHWKSKDYLDKIEATVRAAVDLAFRAGVKAFIRNELKEARERLAQVLELDPQHAQGRELLERVRAIEKEAWEKRQREQLRLDNAEIWFQRGMEFYKRHIFLEAKTAYQKSLEYLDSQTTRYWLGLAEQRVKDLKITEQSRGKSDEYLKLGAQLVKEDKLREAIRQLERALNYYPASTAAEKALADARALLKTRVDKPFNDGVALYKDGKYVEALGKWREALGIDPDYAPAKRYLESTAAEMKERSRYNLQIADTYAARGGDADRLESMKYYKNALDLDPDNIQARRGYDKGREHFEKKSKDLFEKAFLAFKSEQLDKLGEAIEGFEQYLLIKPEDKQARQFLADAKKKREQQRSYFVVQERRKEGLDLFNNRDFERAREKYAEVLRLDPSDKNAAEQLKRIDERLAVLKSRNEVMNVFNEGIRFFKNREYQEAIKTWQKIEKLASASDSDKLMVKSYVKTAEEVWQYNQNKFYLRGEELARQGKLREAKESLDEALRINQYHPQARKLLGDVEDRIRAFAFQQYRKGEEAYTRGDYAAAVKLLEEARSFKEDDERTNNKLDEARENKRLFDEATVAFDKSAFADAIVLFNKVLANNKQDAATRQKVDELSRRLSEQTADLFKKAERSIKEEAYGDALLTLKLVRSLSQYKKDERDKQTTEKYAADLEKKTQDLLNEALRKNYAEGSGLHARGLFAQAVPFLEKVFALDKGYKNVRTLRRESLDRVAAAAAAAQKQNEGRIQQLLYTGINLYQSGQYQQAIAVWGQILAIQPGHAAALSYIARARFKLGQ